MATSDPFSSETRASQNYYSDKQVVSSIDHGPEVVPSKQPYPEAYAYANPNNTNNDSTRGGAQGGGLEAVDQHPLNGDLPAPAWSGQQPKRRICGLSRRNFLIVVAVVTALVVAAIIGGSVGGVLASKNSSGSDKSAAVNAIGTTSVTSATPTPPMPPPAVVITSTTTPSSSISSTATTTRPSTATPTSSEGTYNCPADNDKSYVSPLWSGQTFTILCDVDWPNGMNGSKTGTLVEDITAVVAYSIDTCIDQCVAYNVAGGTCNAVTYGANVTLALERGGIQGNCFLKNQRGATNVADNSGQVESAFLSSPSSG